MKSLVLCSGGLDSVAMLAKAVHESEVHSVLFFDYGQSTASREKHAALYYWRMLCPKAKFRTLQIPSVHLRETESVSVQHRKIQVDIDDLRIAGDPEEMDSAAVSVAHIVPYRNLQFLSFAFGYAAAFKVDSIYAGFDDTAGNPAKDEKHSFLSKCGEMMAELSEGWKTPYIVAPSGADWFGNKFRGQVGAIATFDKYVLSVSLGRAWSCSNCIGDTPCGICGKCLDRLTAFVQYGKAIGEHTVDPAKYVGLARMEKIIGSKLYASDVAQEVYRWHGML